jgi:glycosyltransferase involved in cell wall biosynthesis
MTGRPKILLLITNLGQGGAQRVFSDHAAALSAHFSVEEAVFDQTEGERVFPSERISHDLRRGGILPRLGPLGRLLSRAIALRELVERQGIDLVISHMDGANWVNVLSRSQAKKILVVHGTVLHDRNVSPLMQFFRVSLIFPLMYNLAELTVAVSGGIAKELQTKGRVRRVVEIPNFFDTGSIELKAKLPIAESHAPAFDGAPVLITSGRLAPQKNQQCLLEMVACLRRKGRGVRLVVLGDGELRQQLIRKSLDLDLVTYNAWDCADIGDKEYEVYFLGHVENPYQYIARSTLFLFPSNWEGFPLALCEALICGVPALSADCPTGPREILSPDNVKNTYDLSDLEIAQNGFLLPMVTSPPTLDVWIDAIEILLAQKELRETFVKRGPKATRMLDREKVTKKWLDIVESVCAPQ